MLDLMTSRKRHRQGEFDDAITTDRLPGAAGEAAERRRPERRAEREPAHDWLMPIRALPDLAVSHDPHQRTLWQYMAPRRRPSFTVELLADMAKVLDAVAGTSAEGTGGSRLPVRYLVLASRITGIFNLGGDLSLFLRLIEAGDAEGLRRYAYACIDVQYRRSSNLGLPIHTIALVQGDALGGGFEAALANDVIIAERGTKFGLPEILFNLFPGMGAHSFLSRRLGAGLAERMMLSGRVYTAEELHEMGLIDTIAEPGEGVAAVHDYIERHERAMLGREAIFGLRRVTNPVTHEELIRVTDLWVDTALTLSARDLRRMEHLVTAQDRRWAKIAPRMAAAAE